ncbi:alpha/beta hydrolase [Halopenitus sp. POP-27]|uniref:alpha/beta fold hydrolase n=1 Tax=Halopenitus sp. POP-27 TaxID=2994425 RepID=UPI002469230F|nr:alpha/beta hydrolase [Halopenitus sp. POP-27]
MPTQPSTPRSATVPAASSTPSTGTATKADAGTVLVDGSRRIAHAEYGDPDGTPVLFFHGTPGSRLLATLLEPAATEHGIRLIAFDRPGYGRSDPQPDRTVRDAGANAIAVLDAVGIETAGLVGFSGGSAHALATAATHPDRVDRVDVIAGIAPPRFSDSRSSAPRLLAGLARRAPSVLGSVLRADAWVIERRSPAAATSRYTSDAVDEPVPDDVAAIVKADLLEAVARSRSGVVTEFRTTAAEWGIPLDRLVEADIDVRFRHGDADTNASIADVRRFSQALATAEIRVLEGADHLRTLTRAGPTALCEQSVHS